MPTMIDKLTAIKTAKDNLKTVFEGKGLNPGNDFASYANLVQEQLQPAGNGVKLFSTITEMNADQNPHEGDKAIVYRNDKVKTIAVEAYSNFIFPAQVILPNQITETIQAEFRNYDYYEYSISLELYSSSITIIIRKPNEDQQYLYYSSQDGITFNRMEYNEETGEETIATEDLILNLDVSLYCDPYYWNDNIGYFVNTSGKIFDGFYTYGLIDDINSIKFLKNIIDHETYDMESFDVSYIYDVLNNLFDGELSDLDQYGALIVKRGSIYSLYSLPSDGYWISSGLRKTNDSHIWLLKNSSGWSQTNGKVINIDIDNETFEILDYTDGADTIDTSLYQIASIQMYKDYETKVPNIMLGQIGINNNISGGNAEYVRCEYGQLSKYYSAKMNNITLNNKSQLLPNIIGYGPNGIINGDGSIFDEMQFEDVMKILKIQGAPITIRILNDQDSEYDYGFHYYKKTQFSKTENNNIQSSKSTQSQYFQNGTYGVLGDDENYIYMVSSAYTTYSEIAKISKADFSVTIFRISDKEKTASTNFYYNNGNIYLLSYTDSYGKFLLYKHNISSGVTTLLDTIIASNINTKYYYHSTYFYTDGTDVYWGLKYKNTSDVFKLIAKKVSSSGSATYIKNNIDYPITIDSYRVPLIDRYYIVPPTSYPGSPIAYDVTTWNSTTLNSVTHGFNNNYTPSGNNAKISNTKFIYSWSNTDTQHYLGILDITNMTITEYTYDIPTNFAMSCMVLDSNTLILSWGTQGTYILEIDSGEYYRLPNIQIGSNSSSSFIRKISFTNDHLQFIIYDSSIRTYYNKTITNLSELNPSYNMTETDLITYKYRDNQQGPQDAIIINKL